MNKINNRYKNFAVLAWLPKFTLPKKGSLLLKAVWKVYEKFVNVMTISEKSNNQPLFFVPKISNFSCFFVPAGNLR